MLLVTRQDRFPPAGTAINLVPMRESGRGPAISGRIVYTRFSPRAALRFAGLKFETDLNDDTAASIGLGDREDPVGAALRKLDELEALVEIPAGGGTEAEETVPDALVTDRGMDDGELARLRRQLDAAADEFIAASTRFLEEWGESYLQNTIADKHALARAKGIDGLRTLKAEWRALRADLPVLVDAQLNRDHLWPSRNGQSAPAPDDRNPFYDVKRDQPARPIVDETRKLMGFIGRIVVRHGFDDLGDESEWSPLAHKDALVSYTGRVVFPDSLRSILCRAAASYDTYAALVMRVAEERDSDSRAAALRLWEQA